MDVNHGWTPYDNLRFPTGQARMDTVYYSQYIQALGQSVVRT